VRVLVVDPMMQRVVLLVPRQVHLLLLVVVQTLTLPVHQQHRHLIVAVQSP